MCDRREKGVGVKGSTRRGRVKSWYGRNAMVCEPSIVVKHSHDKSKPSCLPGKNNNVQLSPDYKVCVAKLVAGQQLS